MKKTPLFAAQQMLRAEFDAASDWMLAGRFAPTIEEEVDAARTACGLFDLCDVQVLRFRGDEVRRFCNDMFTNNVTKLAVGAGQRAAMCDDRGRVHGLLDLYCVGEREFIAVLEGSSLEQIQERYKAQLMLDDIEVERIECSVLSLQGPGAVAALGALGLPVPATPRGFATVGAAAEGAAADAPSLVVAAKDRVGLAGFDLLVPMAALEACYAAALRCGARPIGRWSQEALRVAAGQARWPADADGDKAFVHELGINVEVCAFDKGCYIGQEVINRIDVKGQVTKRITPVEIDGDVVPLAGAEVHLGDELVGRVTSAVRLHGRTLALVMLRRAAWPLGTGVQVGLPTGKALARVIAASTGAASV